MASRTHRMHHYLWHQTRNSWARYPQSTRSDLDKLGWTPPRVHLDWETNVVLDNNAGEDFLFMHRQMINAVNVIWQKVDPTFPGISGWTQLPEPGDVHFPVPERYEHPDKNLNEIAAVTKTDEYYEKKLLFWERMFRDCNFLRSISLGKLGSMIETTIHDAMHMRWSAMPSVGIRPDTSADGTTGGVIGIDPKWDDPAYDFLGDEYAAHVNPIFWRIHGWVDDRISDWMIANGVKIGFHTSRVDPQWLGTWQGVLPAGPVHEPSTAGGHDHHGGGHGHDHDHGDPQYTHKLESAVSTVLKSGVIHHIYGRTQGR